MHLNEYLRKIVWVSVIYFTGCVTKSTIKGVRELLIASSVSLTEDKTLLQTPMKLPPCKSAQSWSQLNESATHVATHHCLDANAIKLLWKLRVGNGTSVKGKLRSNLVAQNGHLFGGTMEGRAFAIDLNTKKLLWRASIAENVDDVARIGGVAITESGDIVVTASSGDVCTLNHLTGEVKQKVHLSSPIRSAPTICPKGMFVQSSNNSLFALDHKLSILWRVSEPYESLLFLGNASPTYRNGIVFAAYSTGDYRAYYIDTGTEVWSDFMTSQFLDDTVGNLLHIYASQVISDDIIFTLGHGGCLTANSANSGSRIWSAKFSGLHTPAVIGDWLFATDEAGYVYCVQKSTGKVRWAAALPEGSEKRQPRTWTSPMVAGGTVVIVTEFGHIVFFDAADGHIVNTLKSGAKEPSCAIIVDKVLYVLSGLGYVYAFG
jgi:outer membrane protein assembly factor BamB